MRYPASEKLEIIRPVERSHLAAKATLDMLGVARPTFYRWCDLYQRFSEAALEDGRPGRGGERCKAMSTDRIAEACQANLAPFPILLDRPSRRCARLDGKPVQA